MFFRDLSPQDKELALQCMKFIANGSEIEDAEFHTRLGIVRQRLIDIISLWPELDDGVEDSAESLAINNCFNEVCYGIAIPQNLWTRSFSQPKEKVEQAYSNWLTLRATKRGGIR